jgi:hypothetical protein
VTVAEDQAAIGGEARETLAGLADVVIPPGDEMPSGGEVLIERGQLDAVLRVRPDLAEGLGLLLERAHGAEPAAEVDRLRAEDDAAFQLLATVVAGGYFLDKGVRDALGYPGQEAVPIVRSDPPDYERDGLLAAVVERGPIYRPTPPPDSP